ncbi:hypothetical protein [Pseudomonas asiatica]|uniref:hypothetical protein n=1 Tax=Pseudomonas asiatica TaxID=2219225 RepID=UPI0018AB9875|nr:hypothetical protein [Pseudomonas asiatica]MBF8789672.1 hypothetical protein [Pseudomonas asiatica]
MKHTDSSNLQNELSATARSLTEASLGSLYGRSDVEAKNSEWARFCLRHRAVEETFDTAFARVELPQIDGPTEFRIAASFAGGKQMSCTLFILMLGDIVPLPITSCQVGTITTLREGYALIIPAPDDVRWTDDVWPTSMDKLHAFVANITNSPGFLQSWVMDGNRESNKLLMLVVTRGDVCYGFLLGSPKTAGYRQTRVIPIFFEQVGEFTCDSPVLIELALNIKSLEALLRHARQLLSEPSSARQDCHLRDALGELTNALERGANRSHSPDVGATP